MNRYFFLFFLLWTSPAALATDLLWDKEIHFQGTEILETDWYHIGGTYILPNEFHNYLVADCLPEDSEGALIAVGSFRALNLAVLRDFKLVVLYDYDLVTVAFNKLNLELIRISQDRLEYLSYLLTGDLQHQLLSSVRSGKLSEAAYVDTLIAFKPFPNQVYKKLPLSLPSLSDHYINKFFGGSSGRTSADLFDVFDHHQNISSALRDTSQYMNINTLAKFYSSNVATFTYFGNDASFDRLKKMIEEDRILVVAANLTGSNTLPSLASALRTLNISVVAFDVSNIFDYFTEEFRGNGNPAKEMQGAILNLEQMPWAKESRLLLTKGWADPTPEKRPWEYIAVKNPNQGFLKSLSSEHQSELGKKRKWTATKYYGFLKSLGTKNSRGAVGIPREACLP